MSQGKKFSEVDFGQSALAAAGGFASGIAGCAANGGRLAQVLFNAGMGFQVSTVNAICENRKPTTQEIVTGITSGAVGGAFGGPGGGANGVLGRELTKNAVKGGFRSAVASTKTNKTLSNIWGGSHWGTSKAGSSFGLFTSVNI